jgi:hypothetical protein
MGTTLDLFDTAAEVVDTAVPRFADATVIYIAERLLAADELGTAATGPGMSAVTLLSRGVAHVIDQGPGLVLFYWLASLAVVVTRWPGRLLGR